MDKKDIEQLNIYFDNTRDSIDLLQTKLILMGLTHYSRLIQGLGISFSEIGVLIKQSLNKRNTKNEEK